MKSPITRRSICAHLRNLRFHQKIGCVRKSSQSAGIFAYSSVDVIDRGSAPSYGEPNHPQSVGKSLLPLINDDTVPPRNAFLEWAPNRTKIKKGTKLARQRVIKRAVEESTRTVVTPDGWKLCLRDKDSNELYNLKDDPFETRNLYSDAQHASVVSRLSGEIYRWQEMSNDKLKL
jgi:hypothetical protein